MNLLETLWSAGTELIRLSAKLAENEPTLPNGMKICDDVYLLADKLLRERLLPTFSQMRGYFIENGWTEQKHPNPNLLAFIKHDIRIAVPSEKNYDALRVLGILETVGSFDGTVALLVYAKMCGIRALTE